ncbi:hypothetical protein BHM03_00005321 [Ensete ventricosum]|nr:hypothetical protein BHM03_00005321 [Ensete ventricosum]
MGLITHNRIYVCIGASPCPVIVDLVIIGFRRIVTSPCIVISRHCIVGPAVTSTLPLRLFIPLLAPICVDAVVAALRRWRHYTPSAWAVAPSAGVAALGRHLVGGQRRLVRALPLLAAALANGSPGRGLPLAALQRAGAVAAGASYACEPVGGCPCKGVLAVADRPLTAGLGRSRLPLAAGLAVGGRPCMGVGRPSSSLFLLQTHRTILRNLISSHAV